ncbi:response regulator transcription factor [Burkholderia metallica]|uniref:response regulator transcription factor n=1 Tax=Burkholderia metallica TaxID=488729 RepID=UPI00157ACED5|nr:response regulator transcription factor [Burkholderia metallica]
MVLRDIICCHLAAHKIPFDRFDDEASFARALARQEFDAILVSMEGGVDLHHPVLVHRACYGVQRAPLIVIGRPEEGIAIAELLDYETDEVVLGPIRVPELLLRLYLTERRVKRAQPPTNQEVLACGPYRLDRHSSVVSVAGDAVRLTSREFAIAWMLFAQIEKYVSREQIARGIWGQSEGIVGRTLEQHIYKLRKKLCLNGVHGAYLRTMYGVGYRIFVKEYSYTGLIHSSDMAAVAADTF